MRTGMKRWWITPMFLMVPLVWAEPISGMQDAVPFTAPKPTLLAEAKLEITKSPTKFKALSFYGTASWYSRSDPSIQLRTANGEIFDDTKMTCASWDFPFGTRLKITNLQNGDSVICRVNDRGPAKRLHRIVDLTRSAFRRIGTLQKGLVKVRVTPVK